MPRDIDELHVITHCEDQLHAPFGDFNGPFGQGRYENGQSRGNYHSSPEQSQLTDPLSQKLGWDIVAAARRSEDPGVIELNVQLPFPSSTGKESDPAHEGNQKSVMWADSERAETLAHLPFNWGKQNWDAAASSLVTQPDGYSSQNTAPVAADTDASTKEVVDSSEMEFQKINCGQSKAREQRQLAMTCMRKWKISSKVDGVSTRSTLFPSAVDGDKKSSDKSKRSVVRPMLSSAILPSDIQTGQSVSTDEACELDEEGLAYSLGSYDCRYTEMLLTPKKDGGSRAKRIEVGRTRLIWTSLAKGDDPSASNSRNRINFNSLITGHRVDPARSKRPRDVKVGVRVNGALVMEEALEVVPVVASGSARKRKVSTRQSEVDISATKFTVECPTFRTEEEIEAAFHFSTTAIKAKRSLSPVRRIKAKGTVNGAIVYLDVNAQSLAPNQISRNDIIASLLKVNQKKQKKLKRNAPIDSHDAELEDNYVAGIGSLLKNFAPPRFSCLPLEDGLLRIVCMSAGKMNGLAVHQVIREVSAAGGEKCSICWTDEGKDNEGVQECVECGLLAHTNCCLDKGEFVETSKKDTSGDTAGSSEDQKQRWRCSVCCHHTEKPRRIARLPARFSNEEKEEVNHITTEEEEAVRSKNIPGPRCSLCPHRGGAMSRLRSANDNILFPPQWNHEVCRVWCGADFPDKKELEGHDQYPKVLSNVCALCGTGGMRRGEVAGLTKCAARGCFVAFHPMCALLASKASTSANDEQQAVKTRKTRLSFEQVVEEKKLEDDRNFLDDKKLCNEYTLQLVQLKRKEGSALFGEEDESEKTTILPVAFCGLHNPKREDSFYGCLPGGGVTN